MMLTRALPRLVARRAQFAARNSAQNTYCAIATRAAHSGRTHAASPRFPSTAAAAATLVAAATFGGAAVAACKADAPPADVAGLRPAIVKVVQESDAIYNAPETHSRQELFDYLAAAKVAQDADATRSYGTKLAKTWGDLEPNAAVPSDAHSPRERSAVDWRLARACHELALEPDTPAEEKRALMYKGLMLAGLAATNDDGSFAAHKWLGILMSAVGDYEGTKARIGRSYEIKKEWDRAVALAPGDATSHHLLGRWAFSIASLSWVERNVAKLLFGAPPATSIAEALGHFRRAEAISPGFWKKNALMIAKCHLAGEPGAGVGEAGGEDVTPKAAAEAWLIRALEIPTKSTDDRLAHDEALVLLKKKFGRTFPAE